MNNPDLIFDFTNYKTPWSSSLDDINYDSKQYHEWMEGIWTDWVDSVVSKIINAPRCIWRIPQVYDFNEIPYQGALQIYLVDWKKQPLFLIRLSHSPSYSEIWQICNRMYTQIVSSKYKQYIHANYFCFLSNMTYDQQGTIRILVT